MRRLSVIFALLLTLLILLTGCDNGSVSGSDSSDGLVKVCLAVDGDAANMQRSVSVNGTDLASLTYQYNAVPQFSGNNIHGSAGWTQINYSNQMDIGYFSPGQWVFGVRILNGSNVIYEGFSEVINVASSSVTVEVLVNKLITDAVAGAVRVRVTAPTAQSESLTVTYSDTASGSAGSVTATSADGRTTFETTVTSLTAGNYTFTLTHSSGVSQSIAVTLPEGRMAIISGHLDNGSWQLGYTTIPVYSITISKTNKGIVQSYLTSAAEGDRVSFRVKAYKGSEISGDITVTWSGATIYPTNNGNLYSFIMPAGNVSVNVTFTDVNLDIDISDFKEIFQALYSVNVDKVKTFGRSAVGPGSGIDDFELNDMTIWFDGTDKICWYSQSETIKFKSGSMADLFKDCDKLTSISLSGMDTTAVNNMSGLFNGCTALETVNLTGVDTSTVQNMSSMFLNCNALASLDLSGFDTGAVKDMSKMFMGCYGLTTLDVSGFDTSKVTDMSYMFSSGVVDVEPPLEMNISYLDVSHFDTSKVTNMSHMFYMCYKLKNDELVVSGFNTSKVTKMDYMFACYAGYGSKLTTLNLSGWDFAKVTTIAHMFDRCEKLNTGLTFPTTTNFKSLTTMTFLFSQCLALTPKAFASIVSTWKFGEHNNYPASIYGESEDSMFGNTNTSRDVGANYIFRDTMTKPGGKFASRHPVDPDTGNQINYITKDGVQLWIGEGTTVPYGRLSVYETIPTNQ